MDESLDNLFFRNSLNSPLFLQDSQDPLESISNKIYDSLSEDSNIGFNRNNLKFQIIKLKKYLNEIEKSSEIFLDFIISNTYVGNNIKELIVDIEKSFEYQINLQNSCNRHLHQSFDNNQMQYEEEHNTNDNDASIDSNFESIEQNSFTSYNEILEKKPPSDKIENIRKKVKKKILKYTSQILNKKLHNIDLPTKEKLSFKHLDKKFTTRMKIDENREWNKKSLFDLYTYEFSESNNKTKNNIEIINRLEKCSKFNKDSENLIVYLKNYSLKDMIFEYINSKSFKTDIRKFQIEYNDEAVEQIKAVAFSYIEYYDSTPGNKKKLGIRRNEIH